MVELLMDNEMTGIRKEPVMNRSSIPPFPWGSENIPRPLH